MTELMYKINSLIKIKDINIKYTNRYNKKNLILIFNISNIKTKNRTIKEIKKLINM